MLGVDGEVLGSRAKNCCIFTFGEHNLASRMLGVRLCLQQIMKSSYSPGKHCVPAIDHPREPRKIACHLICGRGSRRTHTTALETWQPVTEGDWLLVLRLVCLVD